MYLQVFEFSWIETRKTKWRNVWYQGIYRVHHLPHTSSQTIVVVDIFMWDKLKTYLQFLRWFWMLYCNYVCWSLVYIVYSDSLYNTSALPTTNFEKQKQIWIIMVSSILITSEKNTFILFGLCEDLVKVNMFVTSRTH